MTESVYQLVLLTCFTGLVAGFLAGLLGIGGGLVVVPALYYLFQHLGAGPQTATAMAIATSLTCIVPTALSSVHTHHKLGNLDLLQLVKWTPTLFVGAVTGAFTLFLVDDWWLRLVFTVLIVFVAASLLKRSVLPAVKDYNYREAQHWGLARRLVAYPLTFTIAGLSSMAGVGGGALAGPWLASWGYPIHRAIGTAGGFGIVISVPAVLMILISGETRADAPALSYSLVNIPAFVAISFCSVITAPWGAKAGKRLPHKFLASLLAVMLLIIGIKMISSLLV